MVCVSIYWNFKHLYALHNTYKMIYHIVVSDLRNGILKNRPHRKTLKITKLQH